MSDNVIRMMPKMPKHRGVVCTMCANRGGLDVWLLTLLFFWKCECRCWLCRGWYDLSPDLYPPIYRVRAGSYREAMEAQGLPVIGTAFAGEVLNAACCRQIAPGVFEIEYTVGPAARGEGE